MKWVLVAVMVSATVLSDLLQSHEMKRAGEQSVSARGLARLMQTIAQRRLLILGVACNAVSFFAFMALVQREPLSFAVPASSASFCDRDASWRSSSCTSESADEQERRGR